MKNPIQTSKKIKELKRCSFPGCKQSSIMEAMLSVGQFTESGQIDFPQEGKNEVLKSKCPLCKYHLVFARKGILNLVNQNGLVQLFGAYPIIEIVEAVIDAREINKEKKNGK